jgi:hypothetical protein
MMNAPSKIIQNETDYLIIHLNQTSGVNMRCEHLLSKEAVYQGHM